MNKVILMGRLTKDPEIKNTASQVPFCNFTIAVDRRFKDANGQRQADFISCVAWRQTATFINSYFKKGSKIMVCGSLQSRSYDDNNGQKRYVTEVIVDEAEFCESSGSRDGAQAAAPVSATPAANHQAPSAPKAPIAPQMDSPVFEETDDGIELPFEI